MPIQKRRKFMDTKQDQAVNRLLKKLSSLRATLKNDERRILDNLLTGSADEVTSHSMNVGAVSKIKTPIRTTAVDEAAAHSMNVGAVSKTKTPIRTTAEDEAAAHAMSVRIIFDPTKEEYQRVS
jgi:hypothetical protein